MLKLLKLNLIFPNKDYVKYMSEVTSSKLFDGNNIHEGGLYSEEIFGPSGSKARMERFAYINLYRNIIHPLIYTNLISLSSLYKKVIEGKVYVTLKKGKYIEVDEKDGDTGYTYFLETYEQLIHEENDSPERKEKLDLLKKFKNPVYDKLLVYPAGLRDFTVDKYGNVKEHEMVEYYNKILSISSLIKDYKHLGSEVDDIFIKLQDSVNELYDYLFSLVDGKHKIINKNFTSRYVDFGTMNVFTSTPLNLENINDDIDIFATQLGLLQYIKSIDPIAKFCLNNFIGERCFSVDSTKAKLFNTSFKTEYIDVTNKIKDLWTTQKGMDTIFNMAYRDDFLNYVVTIDEHYPLVIEDGEDYVNIYTDSSFIPEGVEVRGITYGELLFYMLIVNDDHKKYPAAITRHPVAGPNSIFISSVKLNTTVESKKRTVNIIDDEVFSKEIINTPIPNKSYMQGFTPSVARLTGLGADHDGDKGLTRILFTEEAIEELNTFMNSTSYFVNTDLTPAFDFEDNISKFVMLTLTK